MPFRSLGGSPTPLWPYWHFSSRKNIRSGDMFSLRLSAKGWKHWRCSSGPSPWLNLCWSGHNEAKKGNKTTHLVVSLIDVLKGNKLRFLPLEVSSIMACCCRKSMGMEPVSVWTTALTCANQFFICEMKIIANPLVKGHCTRHCTKPFMGINSFHPQIESSGSSLLIFWHKTWTPEKCAVSKLCFSNTFKSLYCLFQRYFHFTQYLCLLNEKLCAL